MTQRHLWAPWRISYLQNLHDQDEASGGTCFLCDAGRQDLKPEEQAQRLVLRADPHGVLLRGCTDFGSWTEKLFFQDGRARLWNDVIAAEVERLAHSATTGHI